MLRKPAVVSSLANAFTTIDHRFVHGTETYPFHCQIIAISPPPPLRSLMRKNLVHQLPSGTAASTAVVVMTTEIYVSAAAASTAVIVADVKEYAVTASVFLTSL